MSSLEQPILSQMFVKVECIVSCFYAPVAIEVKWSEVNSPSQSSRLVFSAALFSPKLQKCWEIPDIVFHQENVT